MSNSTTLRCDASAATELNQLYAAALEQRQALVGLERMHARTYANIRRAAYRLAVAFDRLRRAHWNEFRALLISEQGTENYDDAVATWFGPAVRVAEINPHALIKAVGDGMTEKAYMIQDADAFLESRSRKNKRRPTSISANAPESLPDEMDPTEQAKLYHEYWDAARKENRELRSIVTRLEGTVSKLRRQIAKLNSIINEAAPTP